MPPALKPRLQWVQPAGCGHRLAPLGSRCCDRNDPAPVFLGIGGHRDRAVSHASTGSNACSKIVSVRYAIALDQGEWVVRDAITGRSVTRPATSEEAQQAVSEWNARCVTRQVEPPVKVDGWGLSVSCGCGCAPRTAGGVLCLAVMGCDGCVPRSCASLGLSS